jgi:hypothetical protein
VNSSVLRSTSLLPPLFLAYLLQQLLLLRFLVVLVADATAAAAAKVGFQVYSRIEICQAFVVVQSADVKLLVLHVQAMR